LDNYYQIKTKRYSISAQCAEGAESAHLNKAYGELDSRKETDGTNLITLSAPLTMHHWATEK
jgi:hypothetical protein